MEKYLSSKSRRRLLAATGATTFTGLFGGLFSGIKTATAQPLSGAVPEVDRLSVRVVTDSYHHAFEPSRKIGDVDVQRYAFALSKEPPRKALQNEWGLSMHLESARGTEIRQVMIDFGYTPETLNNNVDLLGIDPAKLDALILSHGHYDHFGGMVGFLQTHRSKLKPGLPFYLGGEECFCTREGGSGTNFGALDRRMIADANLRVMFAEQPSLIAGHAFTTGWISLASFERVLSPTRMTIGIKDGVGCAAEKLPPEKHTVTVVPDDFQHEQATCFNLKGRGLVVLTSCAHRGVVNSVKAAMKVSGINKVHAVIGGFHLSPYPPEYLRQAVMALKEINPDYLIPMHCSGEAFIALAQQEMPTKVIRSWTGSRYTFAA